VFALGSHIARHEVRAYLEGEGADVSLGGLYMPRSDQHHDNPVLVVHSAPRCTSRQLYKGVVDEHGHGVFNGHIVVRPGALGTDARQTNKNLLLSDDAEVDTRPRLEILTDDVKCAHGAAVGRLDEDALFYLRSRGVPEQSARGILTYAFAREMVDLVPLKPLRARLEGLVTDRFATSRDGRAQEALG
jgi:Fe-S cluster assembly protein SufD